MDTAKSAPINRVLYGALLVLATAQMVHIGYWVCLEVFGRLGLWPDALVWFDLDAFLLTESVLNQVSLAAFVTLFTTTYILTLQQRKPAVWFLVAAIIVGRIDWIVLAMNVHFTDFFGGLVEFAGQLAMLMLCSILRSRGVLR